jgi:SAM-dependent methyltransferase
MKMDRPRTFSTGFETSKLHAYWNLWGQYHRDQEKVVMEYHRLYSGTVEALERGLGRPIDSARILEIGSGQRFPVTLLLHTAGSHVVGIDTDYVAPRPTPASFITNWRLNGAERAVKTLVRQFAFDSSFYRRLAQVNGTPLRFDGADLRVMDACALDFPDQSFDAVVSFNVFEHIYNVEAATREMSRILRPGGIARIGVCLFPGISGGHHVEWFDPDEDRPRSIPPWDHLRQNVERPQVFLNRLRKRDYLAAFQRHFRVLEVELDHQGEAYLTEQVLGELPDYSRQELLTGAITVLMSKEPSI